MWGWCWRWKTGRVPPNSLNESFSQFLFLLAFVPKCCCQSGQNTWSGNGTKKKILSDSFRWWALNHLITAMKAVRSHVNAPVHELKYKVLKLGGGRAHLSLHLKDRRHEAVKRLSARLFNRRNHVVNHDKGSKSTVRECFTSDKSVLSWRTDEQSTKGTRVTKVAINWNVICWHRNQHIAEVKREKTNITASWSLWKPVYASKKKKQPEINQNYKIKSQNHKTKKPKIVIQSTKLWDVCAFFAHNRFKPVQSGLTPNFDSHFSHILTSYLIIMTYYLVFFSWQKWASIGKTK